MTLPIQAWYSTATEDSRGFLQVDLPSQNFASGYSPSRSRARNLIVGRLSHQRRPDGRWAEEPVHHRHHRRGHAKIAGQEIGPLSDYIAMLALSRGSITMSARTYRPSPT